jgi:hypothetical protein
MPSAGPIGATLLALVMMRPSVVGRRDGDEDILPAVTGCSHALIRA